MDNYLYIANINILDKENDYNRAYSLLSSVRKEKTDKYKFDKDKKLSILTEILLKKALSDLKINSNFEYRFNENNKPYLDDVNIHFNISHSGEYVIVAISENEVGCDIEEVKKIDLKIANKFFYNSEYENIINSSNPLDMFYRYWTLKESFMKSIGLGLSFGLNNFEINIDKQITINQSINNNNYRFKEIDIKGYKCSICLLNDSDVILKEINSI